MLLLPLSYSSGQATEVKLSFTISAKSADVKVTPHQLLAQLIVLYASNWQFLYSAVYLSYLGTVLLPLQAT